MKINALVDREYTSCDNLEEVFELSEWLKERRYLVPIDENLKPVGIVTIDDIDNANKTFEMFTVMEK